MRELIWDEFKQPSYCINCILMSLTSRSAFAYFILCSLV